MVPADGAVPTAESIDLAHVEGVRAYLEFDPTPSSLSTFIDRLRRESVCRWCLAPLRPTPDCSDTVAEAGKAEWLPDTVIEGVRRGERSRLYCDREGCAKAGLLDDPAPRECRDRGQLHQHLDNLLTALHEFYAVDADPDAGHAALEEAIADDTNGGKDIAILLQGLAAALTDT